MKTEYKYNPNNPDGFQYWREQHPDPSSDNPLGWSTVTWITQEQYQQMFDKGEIVLENRVPGYVEISRPVKEWRVEQERLTKEHKRHLKERVQVEVFLDAHDILSIDDGDGIYLVTHPDIIDSVVFELDGHISTGRRKYTVQRRWLVAAIHGGKYYREWQTKMADINARIDAYDKELDGRLKGCPQ